MFDDEPDVLFSDEKVPSKLYTSPQETIDYIQLRFQLARFQVYRIVQLPVTFTFANLHMLIQYMFGWGDTHLHHAEVFPDTVLHDEEKMLGTIKSCGRKRPMEDYELSDYWAIDHWLRFVPANQPIYRVQPKVKSTKDKIDGIMTMQEKGLALESIWTHNEAHNVSDGQCSNAQIAIIYMYNFGDEWTVHITCEQGNIFHRLDTPSNLPIIKDARGAPPVEHVRWDADLAMEDDAEDKKVSPRLFDVSYFQGYCEGKVTSVSRKTRLAILTSEEAEAWYRECSQRQKEKQGRIANGEEDEGDEFDDGGSEYEDFDDEQSLTVQIIAHLYS